jgi:Leucine-rich repeat (LRR) protein
MTFVAQFSNIRRLRIENNPISDAGISDLINLSHLNVLNLNGTRISASGLRSIAEIKSLKSLYLWNTAIKPQDEWVKKLSSEKVNVVFGA